MRVIITFRASPHVLMKLILFWLWPVKQYVPVAVARPYEGHALVEASRREPSESCAPCRTNKSTAKRTCIAQPFSTRPDEMP